MKLHRNTALLPVIVTVPSGPKDLKGIALMRAHEARQAQIEARQHFGRSRTIRCS